MPRSLDSGRRDLRELSGWFHHQTHFFLASILGWSSLVACGPLPRGCVRERAVIACLPQLCGLGSTAETRFAGPRGTAPGDRCPQTPSHDPDSLARLGETPAC